MEFRLLAKMSREKAAKVTGIGKSTIFEMEKGWTDPQIGTLDRLCEAYHRSIGELFEPWLEQHAIKTADEGLFLQLRELLAKDKRVAEAIRVTVESFWKGYVATRRSA